MMQCCPETLLLASGLFGVLTLWGRNTGRDRWHATFLSPLLLTHALGLATVHFGATIQPALTLARTVLPLAQLIARSIHLRKPPSQVHAASQLTRCRLSCVVCR